MKKIGNVPIRQRGYVLVSVMVAAFLVAGIAFLVNHDSALRASVAAGETDVDAARYVAEAGLRHAKWAASASECGSYTDLVDIPFGDHTYSAVYSTSSGSPIDIVTTGVLANGASRRLEATRQPVYQDSIDLLLQPDGATGKDTYLYQWKSTWNYGANGRIQVEDRIVGDWSNGLVEFDLDAIPAAAKIISATLELYQASPSLPGGDFSIHRVTSPWVEGNQGGGTGAPNWTERDAGLLWSTPGGDYDPVPFSTINIPAGLGSYQWDLTALVQHWVSGVSPNFGLAVVPASWGSAALFASSDYATDPTRRPILSITFACECGQTCALPGNSVDVPVSAASDDAEQSALTGYMYLDSSDLELAVDGLTSDMVGLRFANVDVPAGATITNAYIQFQVDETDSGTTSLSIRAEAVDTAPTFVSTAYDISDRVLTSAAVSWLPADWTTVGERGVSQQTPSIAPVIQEIVSRPGWSSGNAIAVIISGSGTRTAESFEGDPAGVAVLHIDYTGGSESSGKNVLFVVGSVSGAGPTTAELDHKALLESWGYTVELIDDDATQAEFDTAVAGNDVVFLTNDVTASRVGTKLVDAAIGVVTSEDNLSDEFGLASSIAWDSGSSIEINDNGHYITEPFSLGLLPILTTSESLAYVTGTLSADLGQLASTNSGYAVVTLEAGAAMYGGGTAAGRRAQLPWGGSGFNPGMLNADGQAILKRAIEWGAGTGVPMASGPMAHWKLDDGVGTGAIDSVGGHHGTLVNDPVWVAGTIDNALQFDGADDYVDLTSDPELTDVFDGGATVLAWIYPTSWGENGYGRILDKSSSASSTGDGWVIRMNVDNGGIINFGQGFSLGRGWWKPPNGSISLNKWQHLAVAYDAGSTANDPLIYIDGSPVAVTRIGSPSGSIRSDAAINLRLGNFAGGTSHSFEGKIDDVRIYDKILSAAEIATIASAGGGGGGGGAGSCDGTFRDEFNAQSFAGSDGSLTWATDWIEVGESDGPTSGDTRVTSDVSNYQLQTRDNNNGGEGVEREANLDGAVTATLSYDYRREALDKTNDYTSVEISANGAGGPWTELTRYAGPGSDSGYQPASHDISSFVSPSTRVRFMTSSKMGGSDIVWFDNIEIACTP